MGTFNLIEEFAENGKVHNSEYVSVNPHWVMLIVRYSEPLTSSKQRIAIKSSLYSGDVSYSDDPSQISKTRKPILITNDCVSMDISSSKGRYVHTLNAVLKHSKRNYLSSIMPGDWVMAWVMNSKETYDKVIENIKKKLPTNGFWDGLKFIGRVHDVRKVLMQQSTGLKTIQYNLQATAFSEFDSAQFFDPNLSRNEKYIEQYLRNLNIPLAEIMEMSAANSEQIGGISINKVLPALIKAFFGEGIRGVATESGGLKLAEGASINTEEAPYSYVIPDSIAPLLQIKSASKVSGIYSYADMLEVVQGLQKYDQSTFPNMFFPEGTRDSGTYPNRDLMGVYREGVFEAPQYEKIEVTQVNQHFTKYPLQGVFLPMPTSFNMRTVWELINQYLNPAVNEAYTSIKYSPSGRVMPSLVVRQLPFSSIQVEANMKNKATSFYELPRWKAEPVLIRGMDIGRSDSLRTNYIHIYAQSTKPTLISSMALQITKWPPVADSQDIKRSGLRPHMGEVMTSYLGDGPNEWMKLRADFLMGQHLMLNGVCSMTGTTAPISIGDNFEFDGVIYHIEGVNHSCSVSPDGQKTFTTQLQLTHGVAADPYASSRGGGRSKTMADSRIRDSEHTSTRIKVSERVEKHNRKNKNLMTRMNLDKELRKEFEKLNFSYDSSNTSKMEIETLSGEITNPDITIYSGVYEDDNTNYDPGITYDYDEEKEDLDSGEE